MPQGPDISKIIRTMRKDIDQARKGGPVEEYIPPVTIKPAVSSAPVAPVKKAAGFSNPVSSASTLAGLKGEDNTEQMQKMAEEKQRMEKLRIEEQKRKEAEAMAKKQEEERLKKIEESKKEEERVRKYREEEAKKVLEEQKRKAEQAEQLKKRIKDSILKEDLSAKKREILEERKSLDKDKSGFNVQLKEIVNLKKPLENEKNVYLKKINELKNSRSQLVNRESQIEAEKTKIEEKEASSLSEEGRKKLEKERWQAGEKRRQIEKKRWTIEEDIKAVEVKIENLDLKYWPIKEKEESIKSKIAEFEVRENSLKDKVKEVELKEEFRKSEEMKEMIEKKIGKFRESQVELSRKLKIVLNEEKLAEVEEKAVEEKEKLSDNLDERKKIEEKRWLIEKQRQEIEKKRWQLESVKKEIDFDLGSAEKILNNLKDKHKLMFAELERVVTAEEPIIKKEVVLEKPKPVIAPKKEDIPVFEKKEEIILPNSVSKIPEKKIEEPRKENIIEEKAGIEITTPVKEFKEPVFEKVKNEPVEIEESIKNGVDHKSEVVPPISKTNVPPQIKAEAPPTKSILATHPLPKKAGIGKKIFARILAISLLAALLFFNITFWYWYLVIRQPSQPVTIGTPSPTPLRECFTDEDCDVGKTCDSSGKCVSKPITVLGSLFDMTEEKRYNISDYLDIPGIILSVVSDWPNEEGYGVDKFKRLVIINEKESRVASVKEIFDSLLISVPEGFYERLGDNYTLFAYSQEEGVRVGIVSLIIDSDNFQKLLLQNESTMKDGFVTIFSLMNVDSPLTTKTFSSASKVKGYTGTDFRFLPISKNDLGVCYSVYDKYFVFGSSFESTKKVLENLKPSVSPSPNK